MTTHFELIPPADMQPLAERMKRTICGSDYVLRSADPKAEARELMDMLGLLPS